MANLFEAAGLAEEAPRPLADRLRPQSLSDVVGQDHLVGAKGVLTRMIEADRIASIVLWGPPGTGKTTIARLLAGHAGLYFEQMSAIFSGVADLKKAFEAARARRQEGRGTLPVHRRDPPLQPRPAGLVSALHGRRHRHAGRRHHRKPLIRADRRALSRAQVLTLNRLGPEHFAGAPRAGATPLRQAAAARACGRKRR
jgi:putative ATPase